MAEIKTKEASIYGVYQIIETFIKNDSRSTLTQLLSVVELQKKDATTIFAQADFDFEGDSWRLQKHGDRTTISSDEYYALLLSTPNLAVEPKARLVFTLNDVRYSLETNTERNYSVIQVDYAGDVAIFHGDLLQCFDSIDVLGELYMSLEETFARLHLEQRPAGSLEDAVSILSNALADQKTKAGI